MGMLADEVDYVIGVDTHRDQHTLAVVVSPTGAVVAQSSIRTDRHGYEAALEVAGRHTVGARLWAIEGCGQACGCQNSVLPAKVADLWGADRVLPPHWAQGCQDLGSRIGMTE